MFKKTIIALGLSAIALTSMQTGAMAGGGHGKYGYNPLWWNGPSGYEHTALFKKGHKYKTYKYKSCYSFKKKYINTGHKKWLRKYEICKVDQY